MTKKIIGNNVTYGLEKEELIFLADRYKHHYKNTQQSNLDDAEYQCLLHYKAVTDLLSKNIPNLNFSIEKTKTFDFDDDRIG